MRTLRYFLRLYKIVLSPFIGGQCRFYPTCSEYFVLSVEKYGFLKGFILSIKRILRCNPFFKGGVDYP